MKYELKNVLLDIVGFPFAIVVTLVTFVLGLVVSLIAFVDVFFNGFNRK